jgi:protein TonB
VLAASVGAHVALLAGIVWASAPDDSDLAVPDEAIEEVTYIDIAEIPPAPEEVFEEPPADQPPAPVEVRQAPAPQTRPATPRRPAPLPPASVVTPEPAGFQELRPPAAVTGIPAPDPSQAVVRADDFGGRGAVGGTASGTPPAGSGSDRIGTGTTGTGDGDVAPTGTFSSNLVDRQAELSNREDVVRALERLYPTSLRERGIEGTVQVQFVVTAEGRVDMSTVKILSSTNSQFAEAAKRAMQEFRFRPARKGEHNVRMLTVLPVVWKLR